MGTRPQAPATHVFQRVGAPQTLVAQLALFLKVVGHERAQKTVSRLAGALLRLRQVDFPLQLLHVLVRRVAKVNRGLPSGNLASRKL
jgi:hypothetical protein